MKWSKFEKGLAELGLSLESISAVIATHAHADHFGLAKQASDHGLRVSVHADEETRALGTYKGRFAVDASELPKFNIHALRTFIPMLLAGVSKLDHVDAVNTFGDGEHLDLPGHPVPIHTPGHTEGHAMFHCEALGLLFTGDGLSTMDLLGPDRGPQMMEERFHLDSTQAARIPGSDRRPRSQPSASRSWPALAGKPRPSGHPRPELVSPITPPAGAGNSADPAHASLGQFA